MELEKKKKPILTWFGVFGIGIALVVLIGTILPDLTPIGVVPIMVSLFALSVLSIDFEWLSKEWGVDLENVIVRFFIWYFGITISFFLAIGKLVRLNNDKKRLMRSFGIKENNVKKAFAEQQKRVQELEAQRKK